MCVSVREIEGDRATKKERETERECVKVKVKVKAIQCSLSLGSKPLGVAEEFHCVNLDVITESRRKQ